MSIKSSHISMCKCDRKRERERLLLKNLLYICTTKLKGIELGQRTLHEWKFFAFVKSGSWPEIVLYASKYKLCSKKSSVKMCTISVLYIGVLNINTDNRIFHNITKLIFVMLQIKIY